jgi:glycine cleavage system protein P-like pyridoxal-binding family
MVTLEARETRLVATSVNRESLRKGMREHDVVEEIIDTGVRQGTLTYDEINDALLSEFFSLDELEDIMDVLDHMGVKVVDFRRPLYRRPRKKAC